MRHKHEQGTVRELTEAYVTFLILFIDTMAMMAF